MTFFNVMLTGLDSTVDVQSRWAKPLENCEEKCLVVFVFVDIVVTEMFAAPFRLRL